jgi:hypothetical protein
MNEVIKDNVLYNSNPELNDLARAMFSLGEKKVGDIVFYFSTKYKVIETNVKVFGEDAKYKHGIIAKDPITQKEIVLTNRKERTDFSSIWE